MTDCVPSSQLTLAPQVATVPFGCKRVPTRTARDCSLTVERKASPTTSVAALASPPDLRCARPLLVTASVAPSLFGLYPVSEISVSSLVSTSGEPREGIGDSDASNVRTTLAGRTTGGDPRSGIRELTWRIRYWATLRQRALERDS